MASEFSARRSGSGFGISPNCHPERESLLSLSSSVWQSPASVKETWTLDHSASSPDPIERTKTRKLRCVFLWQIHIRAEQCVQGSQNLVWFVSLILPWLALRLFLQKIHVRSYSTREVTITACVRSSIPGIATESQARYISTWSLRRHSHMRPTSQKQFPKQQDILRPIWRYKSATAWCGIH